MALRSYGTSNLQYGVAQWPGVVEAPFEERIVPLASPSGGGDRIFFPVDSRSRCYQLGQSRVGPGRRVSEQGIRGRWSGAGCTKGATGMAEPFYRERLDRYGTDGVTRPGQSQSGIH